MWIDAYVHDTIIRAQIAESDRLARLGHLLRGAAAARAPRPWWTGIGRILGAIAGTHRRRPVAPVAAR